MDFTAHPDFCGHEKVVFVDDPASELKAIIAVHSTTLGPAAGGCRIWSYRNQTDALSDVLRLSRGMTYKNAIAGLDLGGGKAVIMLRDGQQKTKPMMLAFGRAVEKLEGDYYTAEDVGSTTEDMAAVRTQTSYVAGLSEGKYASGNPSPVTARGVFEGIKLACANVFDRSELDGLRVAVQGVGHVGWYLCEMLRASGAQLIISDVNHDRCRSAAERFGADIADPNRLHAVECDVYAPCALGGTLTSNSIEEIKAKIVAGAANNQLGCESDAELLHGADILYVPDFLINAGGILNAAREIKKITNSDWVEDQISTLVNTMQKVLDRSRIENRSPHYVAMKMAEDRVEAARLAAAE
ncbi:Glu/Leu/Phe/Val family dehydrogenase [Roseibium sp. Sym1]|uniref:Glu/Leu/Phe/Val family dehydrogenase n=1 Tax=Roseibium sp. Sym1 TaxID=3016006 RepID=UPI0022B48781|nr:Glu/Leu/Phe/Val dehydrogenase dimerization domain-containing protein [Roseibium sp. Sym1]